MQAAFLVDATGEGGTLVGIAQLAQSGTYAAVCAIGDYPDFTFTLSDPFEVGSADAG